MHLSTCVEIVSGSSGLLGFFLPVKRSLSVLVERAEPNIFFGFEHSFLVSYLPRPRSCNGIFFRPTVLDAIFLHSTIHEPPDTHNSTENRPRLLAYARSAKHFLIRTLTILIRVPLRARASHCSRRRMLGYTRLCADMGLGASSRS